jgi:hypothetical protein
MSLILGKAVPVARKLRTIEERSQGQSCLFRRRYTITGKKGHNLEKVSSILALAKVVSSARQLRSIEAWNPMPNIAKY